MSEETNQATQATQAEATAAAAQTETQQEKTFTQAELDTIIADRLARAKKAMPSDDELKAYRIWKEGQQTEIERTQATITKANTERDEAISAKAALERKVTVLSQGVPGDLADKYAKLAEAYMDDSTPFDKALAAALKDFPVVTGVPGAGNPPPTQPPNKGRPEGTVIF